MAMTDEEIAEWQRNFERRIADREARKQAGTPTLSDFLEDWLDDVGDGSVVESFLSSLNRAGFVIVKEPAN